MGTKTSKNVRLVIGSEFRVTIADGRVLFRVTDIDLDRGRVTAEAVNEPIEIDGKTYDSDHAGLVQDFLIEEVQRVLNADALWERFVQDQDQRKADFWNSVEPGQVLHYNDSGNRWVRGVAERRDGRIVLVSTALVGDWPQRDLATRDETGQVHHGYHASRVLDGEVFTPQPSFIFESPTFNRRAGQIDPSTLDALSLTLPEPTAEEQAQYDAGALLAQARDIMQDHTRTQIERFNAVRALIA